MESANPPRGDGRCRCDGERQEAIAFTEHEARLDELVEDCVNPRCFRMPVETTRELLTRTNLRAIEVEVASKPLAYSRPEVTEALVFDGEEGLSVAVDQ